MGVSLLVLLAIGLAEALPSGSSLLWGAASGLSGGLGIVALYQGLALGRMGVVAPVSAVVTAGVPVVFSALLEGLPSMSQVAGFALALVAVWLISGSGVAVPGRSKLSGELKLALVAGVGFAAFLILIDQASTEAVLWPLVAARLASITMLFLLALLARRPLRVGRAVLPVIFLTGVLEVGGNAFFALAARSGRLDIAAVLASLYPAFTVLLAWIILRERIVRRQWFGIVIALVAILLIVL